MASNRLVFFFGDGKADGKGDMKNLLGGKGANLAEMSRLGLPVPPGFTITTEVCTDYYENDEQVPEGLDGQVRGRPGQGREDHGRQVRRPGQPAAGLGALRRPGLACPA